MRVVYDNAMDFKAIIEALAKMVDEASLTFNSDAMELTAIDRAHISLIKLRFPKEAFKEYDITEEFRLGFNTQYMLKVLRSAKKKEQLEMESQDPSQINLKIIGSMVRDFVVRNIEISASEIPEINFQFDVKAKVVSSGFKRAINEIYTVSDSVQFNATESSLLLKSAGESEIEVELTKDMGGLQEISIEKPVSSTYSAEYLNDVLVLTKLSGFTKILYSEQKPLQLEFNMDNGGSVVYLLAPQAG